MAYEHSIQQYRDWYAKLLCFYPKPYRERFAEEMEQTFNDLLQESAENESGVLGRALWMFIETSAGIIRENVTYISMQNTMRKLGTWAIVVAAILMIPLVAMQFSSEVNWDLSDFIIMGVLLFGTTLMYELLAKNVKTPMRRTALGLVLLAVLFLIWADLAVGIFNIPGISGS